MASSNVAGPPSAVGFRIHPEDNVATLLQTACAGPVSILGQGENNTVQLHEAIEMGHKIAVRPITAGEMIVKYGVNIGVASNSIEAGVWVHLHNCKSLLDQRSGTMDLHTGLPGDTKYE